MVSSARDPSMAEELSSGLSGIWPKRTQALENIKNDSYVAMWAKWGVERKRTGLDC